MLVVGRSVDDDENGDRTDRGGETGAQNRAKPAAGGRFRIIFLLVHVLEKASAASGVGVVGE